MNRFNVILLLCTTACLFLFGCTSPENRNDSDLIHINVSRSYPAKEINLAEIAKIEFLQLGMYDDFIFGESPNVITENKIIFGEFRTGNIFVFSRDGTPISQFNRRGQGAEEYPSIMRLLFDETTNEIFVQSPTKIMVYSLNGEFKRAIPLLEGAFVGGLVNFNSEYLLFYDRNNIYPTPFSLISKKDGSIKAVDMPIGNKINNRISTTHGDRVVQMANPLHHIIWYNDGFLLNNYATDTLFFFSPNKELSPFLVRTPELHSMDPIVTLSGFVEAGNYQFFETHRLRIETVNVPGSDTPNFRIPRTFLMRNKTTGSIYQPRITFDEFSGREVTITHTTTSTTQNSRLGLISLDLTELQDANDEGRLSGRLREIVENSEEDGNNVFMLLHFK